MRIGRGLVIGAGLGLVLGAAISTTAMIGLGLVGALVGQVLAGRKPGGDQSDIAGYDAEGSGGGAGSGASGGWFGGGDDGDDGRSVSVGGQERC